MTATSLAVIALAAVAAAGVPDDGLTEGWRVPPKAARPHIWWHWMNGNVTKSGITADLEAMAAVGLGGVQLFDAGLPLPAGPLRFASDDWFDHVAFAAHEAERLGLSFGLANCSGWTSSGGPWITPELSMKFVTNTAVRVKGGGRVETRLGVPEKTNGFYEDIAVVAFPTPERAEIPDFERRVFRLRGDERGPFPLRPIAENAFSPRQCVERGSVIDLTLRMDADGRLVWNAPQGEWTVLRIGYMANGRCNRPATAGGAGLECDKLDAGALRVHFNAYIARCIAAIGPCRDFDNVLIDSYEVNGQNWTRGLEREFEKRRGYAVTSYLPVLAGYPVGSAAETDRFLSDFRRVIADLFAENYAGEMARLCHANGLSFACEPYGNSPTDDLQYGAACDIPMGEFWIPRGDGRPMDTRWGNRKAGNGAFVASIAHYWGKPVVGAESFTAYPTPTSGRWLEHPYSIKAQGDRILADGVNRFYFHRYVHQPWTSPTVYPGMTMAYYGGHYERTQTWWHNGFRAYLAYLTRVQFMLQRGQPVSDILFDVGGEAPNFGIAGKAPDGWKCDHANTEMIRALKRDGDRLVSPGGARYRILAKPEDDVAAMLKSVGCAPDFLCGERGVSWIHRRDGDDEIYFVASAEERARTLHCSFRDARDVAELWDPETGARHAAVVRRTGGRAEIDLELSPAGSVFVVFRPCPTVGVKPPERIGRTSERTIRGPWQVSFRAPGAADDTARTEFAELADWTANADEDIRYFSGTATYEISFDVGQTSGTRAFIDLGDVRDIAEISLNGVGFPVLWKPPFRTEVTRAILPGPNRLDVKVTNRWPNRLIGDERAHADDAAWSAANDWHLPLVTAIPRWTFEGGRSPSGRRAFATCKLWKAGDRLLPSGLLGPVRLILSESPTDFDRISNGNEGVVESTLTTVKGSKR